MCSDCDFNTYSKCIYCGELAKNTDKCQICGIPRDTHAGREKVRAQKMNEEYLERHLKKTNL
jgi:hypothetical protein